MMDFFACKKREKTGVYDFPSTGKRSPYAKYVPILLCETACVCTIPQKSTRNGKSSTRFAEARNGEIIKVIIKERNTKGIEYQSINQDADS